MINLFYLINRFLRAVKPIKRKINLKSITGSEIILTINQISVNGITRINVED